MKTIYTVEWKHTHPIWGEVEAVDELEALRLARAGKFIKDTVDSEPGKDHFERAKVRIKALTTPKGEE